MFRGTFYGLKVNGRYCRAIKGGFHCLWGQYLGNARWWAQCLVQVVVHVVLETALRGLLKLMIRHTYVGHTVQAEVTEVIA